MRAPRSERTDSSSTPDTTQWWGLLAQAVLTDVRTWLHLQVPRADEVEDHDRYVHLRAPRFLRSRSAKDEQEPDAKPLIVGGRRISGLTVIVAVLLLFLLLRLMAS